jgi:hypothetical protein
MKKLAILFIPVFLVWMPISNSQASETTRMENNQPIQQDSLVDRSIEIQGSTNNHALTMPNNYASFPKERQSTAVLTGPGKVVFGTMLLCALFFYFNRKK